MENNKTNNAENNWFILMMLLGLLLDEQEEFAFIKEIPSDKLWKLIFFLELIGGQVMNETDIAENRSSDMDEEEIDESIFQIQMFLHGTYDAIPEVTVKAFENAIKALEIVKRKNEFVR